MGDVVTRPVRPTTDIPALKAKCADLERRVTDLETDRKTVEQWQDVANSLQETVDQLLGVIQSGKVAAPVFLRWHVGTDQGCRIAVTTFGKYRLEVFDGSSAVSWSIQEGRKWVDAGGGYTSFDYGMDGAEEALRRLIQEKQTKEVTPST